jgi:hypothetical protein
MEHLKEIEYDTTIKIKHKVVKNEPMVEVIVTSDSDVVYKELSYKKKYIKTSPIREIESFLFAYNEKPQGGTDICNNSCNCANFIRHRRFKAFNFKQQFLNIFRK